MVALESRLPNPDGGRSCTITLTAPLVCRCPVNDRQDHARVMVCYEPGVWLIEYAWFAALLAGFEGTAITHEALTWQLRDDLNATVAPRWLRVQTQWAPVEGVDVAVEVETGEKERG